MTATGGRRRKAEGTGVSEQASPTTTTTANPMAQPTTTLSPTTTPAPAMPEQEGAAIVFTPIEAPAMTTPAPTVVVETYVTREVDNHNTFVRHFEGGDAGNTPQPAFVVVERDKS